MALLFLNVLAAASIATAAEPQVVTYPVQRDLDGYTLLIHEPQIRAWPNFTNFGADVALELIPDTGGPTRYGTATVTGTTKVDLEDRVVHVGVPNLQNVVFSGPDGAQSVEIVKANAAKRPLDIPLDVFLSYLADDVLESPPPKGFNTDAPPIHVVDKPTILLWVNGEPVQTDTAGGLKVVANANWPTFYDAATKKYYLLDDELWLQADKLKGPWTATYSLPSAFEQLAKDPNQTALKGRVPPPKTQQSAPRVELTDKPAELIVTTGKPVLQKITGAGDLEVVANTASPLFKLDKSWYYLVSGRWFSTTRLDKGPWRYVVRLPDEFSQIAPDSPYAAVRASIPGTPEARMAALEASLPTQVTANKNAKPPVDVDYAGEPKFEPIEGTEVARAVNSQYDIIEYQQRYYLCYSGIWYVAAAPVGPWTVATDVPAAIYTIPPSSPVYNVTQVKVVESTPTTVVYSYPPAYTSSIYVVYGVPYYGTGWYYPPYIYGPIYYPYWGSYGHGSWYNPVTGGYGSRSVWYGPYGGYSYTQGYNPRTGRYGYVETAWDNDDWFSGGEKYNPRTGVHTATERHYNADNNKLHTERVRQRGDTWATMDRSVDFDSRTSEVRRQTSGGGSSQVNRSFNNGTMTSSGTATAGDGRTATIEGERTIGQGGSTTITGSEGGKLKSVTSPEGNRTTVGQSGSGDLYAGRNGNVYRKTDNGWSHYENGGWQQVDKPSRVESTNVTSRSNNQYSGNRDYGSNRQYGSSRDMSQLNRDYSARQRGNRQYQQRRSFGGGGFSRGGRMGGGRRR